MKERKELQEKILAYRVLEARLDSLLKQRDLIASKIVEIQTTIQSIEEMGKAKGKTLFPIGSEAYTFGRIANREKLIVEIGANVALEKTTEEGKETLNKRREEMENALSTIQRNILEISSSLEALGPEIRELAKKVERK